jgi:formylglycine-generating enzyme required for sulfatase activity
LKKVTIFLASSGDVQAERDCVERVLQRVANDGAYRDWFEYEIKRWDDEHQPVVFTAGTDMQTSVEQYKGQAAEAAVVIALYKHRFGTALAQDRFKLAPDGLPYTGTQWEVCGALKGSPDRVLFLRSKEAFTVNASRTAAQQDEDWAQYKRVREFFDSNGYGLIRGGYNPYDNAQAFESTFDTYFRQWLNLQRAALEPAKTPAGHSPATATQLAPLDSDQADLKKRLLRDDVVADKALLLRVKASTARSIEAYLLQRYATWAVQEGEALQRHFVNLDLVTDLGPGVEGNRYDRKPFSTLPDLLAADEGAQAWLLVGDPGGGKSTLMQHYEMTQAVLTLRRLNADPTAGVGAATAERPELVIWQRLAEHWLEPAPGSPAGVPPMAPEPALWLGRKWQQNFEHLPPLAELQSQFRVRWLLDGLNEIQRSDDGARVQAHQAWAEWIERPGSAGPGSALAPIFSVRRRDLTSGLGEHTRQASVSAWNADQQRDYCLQRLGPNNALWPAIEKDAALRDLSGNPFQLSAQCELFQALGHPAKNRAELMSGLAWLRLRKAHAKADLATHGLLGREDGIELSSTSTWKQPHRLLHLPAQGLLIQTLDAQALAMHQASGGVALSVPEHQVAPQLRQQNPGLHEAWLRATERLHWAEAGSQFRFSHQLWQEFFAARGLAQCEPNALWLKVLQAPEPPDLEVTVAALGALDPLPGPGATPWEEAFKMAVLLSPAPASWIEALMPVNLALAARAAAGVTAKLNQELLGPLKRQLLTRSRDAAVDVRLRIEAGEALGLLGDDLRYDVIQSKAGVPVRLPNAAHWVTIPAGTYRMGSKRGDKDSEKNEYPVTPVELAAFEMAFAPVTNSEFECFMRASGYEDERWWAWQGEEAMTFLKEGLRNEPYAKQLHAEREEFRRDFEAAKAARSHMMSESYEQGYMVPLRDLTDDQFAAEVERLCAAQAPNGKPMYWDDPLFNQPLQPVVGVTWYEARAYAKWLSHHLPEHTCQYPGDAYGLPTEAQWEAAARGPARALWPWGDLPDPGPGRFSYVETHLRRTHPVGCFPLSDRLQHTQSAGRGDGKQALVDLAGNVWEWCANGYADSYAEGQFNKQSPGGANLGRAVRGGSWNYRLARARPACRSRDQPFIRSNVLGFRLVRCPIQNTEH